MSHLGTNVPRLLSVPQKFLCANDLARFVGSLSVASRRWAADQAKESAS